MRRWLERLYRAIETTDLEVTDLASRIREHRERQERLEFAAEEARGLLAERRGGVDDAETITAFAQDMRQFLAKSEITESRAFLKSFVKEIEVAPGKATIRYMIPMPEDSWIPGLDEEDVALKSPLPPTVGYGGPKGTVRSTTFDLVVAL